MLWFRCSSLHPPDPKCWEHPCLQEATQLCVPHRINNPNFKSLDLVRIFLNCSAVFIASRAKRSSCSVMGWSSANLVLANTSSILNLNWVKLTSINDKNIEVTRHRLDTKLPHEAYTTPRRIHWGCPAFFKVSQGYQYDQYPREALPGPEPWERE